MKIMLTHYSGRPNVYSDLTLDETEELLGRLRKLPVVDAKFPAGNLGDFGFILDSDTEGEPEITLRDGLVSEQHPYNGSRILQDDGSLESWLTDLRKKKSRKSQERAKYFIPEL